ncbi:hypothetical protein CANARDRAFT_9995 [[Candida] arabinofermentans NRRL YB-2248]|uniref:Retrograde transport protein Dsl1 C-terminal domain-containing protein n=1 Tax=[Candida] arabinofermentans NRRL YB-2248 TaxID=983967 RepID=A0A1E4SU38_9ASCO|nr:hypothetical protein CANARDRAFT_9995 [[Candida] arabinofermentans NRRL YB-2248]
MITEIDSQKALEIPDRLNTINSNLKSYISNYDVSKLGLELSRSINFSTDNGSSGSAFKINKYKDKDYVEQLDICNKLWFINGLINELGSLNLINSMNEDWKLVEFQNIIDNYSKLRYKIDELLDSVDKSTNISILNEISNVADSFEEKILKLVELTLTQYIHFNEELEVEYNDIFEGMSFKTFLKSCYDFTSLKNDSDGKGLTKLFNFNKIFNGWITEVLTKLDNGYKVILKHSNESISITFEKCDVDSFLEYTKSIELLIQFFNLFIEFNSIQGTYNPLNGLKSSVSKPLLKSLKLKIFDDKNIYPLILDTFSDNGTSSAMNQLQTILQMLSKEGWSRDGICDLEFWIDDLVNYWMNDLLEKSIDDLKNLFLELKLSKLGKLDKFKNIFNVESLITGHIEDKLIKSTNTDTVKVEKTVSHEDDDDWNEEWGDDDEDDDGSDVGKEKEVVEAEVDMEDDDDAWNEQIDLKLDTTSNKGGDDDDEDDDWNAWNDGEGDENWNLDDEVKVDPNLGVKSLSTNSNPSSANEVTFKYTKISGLVLQLLETFHSNYENLCNVISSKPNTSEVKNDATIIFKINVKKLITCYFMIVQSNVLDYYPDFILFYNDFNKLLEDIPVSYEIDLGSCFNMSNIFINKINSDYMRDLQQIVKQFENTIFKDNSIESSYREEQSKQLLKLLNDFFKNLKLELISKLDYNKQLISNIYFGLVSNLLNYINNDLVSRFEIGSEESETLSMLLSDISNILQLNNELSEKLMIMHSYQKMNQIKLILESNLKSILDYFYDVKFYDLETQELIGLIKSLFVDSSNRQNVIQEIETMRRVD